MVGLGRGVGSGVLCVALLLGAGCSGASSGVPGSRAGATSARAARTDEPHAVAVLREWDDRRAAAYATGSVPQLRRLYVDGSAAGRADVRRLRGYVGRGLVVTGMRMQLLAVEELRVSPRLLRLRVTDRLVGAVARRRAARIGLPRDSVSTHELTLSRVGRDWRVQSVVADPAAAP